MRDPARFWNRIAKSYDKQSKRKRENLLRTIEKIRCHLDPTDRVLDFACGTGEKALGVSDYVQSIHGIDLSPRMIEIASAKVTDRKVDNARFTRTDLFDAALEPESYDAIMAFYVFHLLDDSARMFERICELLKPDGRLICETPCLGESGSAIRWLIALAGKTRLLPTVRCFEIAELEASITSTSSLRLVESESDAENRNHLFIVAKKI
ncbi:MAG: class I SAM-dependent methyltransferase [Deltaproteobacteria bacterium]|jgi:ubiquinone/menaquinone biosynthesis C-methylase UbiE|nr:class I SAM-dependent methyltransferase [Deltaproteobacteria bacterium]